MRTVKWNYDTNQLEMIDQRILPETFEVISYQDHHAVAEAITDMVVRGAPAIGATAAFGLALAGYESSASDPQSLRADLFSAAAALKQARPTAVNLAWALDRILKRTEGIETNVDDLRRAVLVEAQMIADEDVEINQRMAEHGAALIEDGDTIIHHCNTGALATVDWGTALAPIRLVHRNGKKLFVYVDETRPRLQGLLTAWELMQEGIEHVVIADNAAGYFMKNGDVDIVITGADRIAKNGDFANKIGTYEKAVLAKENGIPFYVAAPVSTFDNNIKDGDQITIEERDRNELSAVNGKNIMPGWVAVKNPAFDVTPARFVTGYITENGVIKK